MLPDVAEHARFFDHLVELIPARFYYDEDFTRTNPRFLAKAAREALKADVKLKAKVAKREKFLPEKSVTTLDVQRLKKQQAQHGSEPNGAVNGAVDGIGPSTSGRQAGKDRAAAKADAGPGQAAAAAAAAGAAAASGLQLQLGSGALSRQELLERLHKKVEEARKRRKASDETAAQAKEWKQNALKGGAAAAAAGKQQQHQQQQGGKQQQNQKRKAAEGGAQEAGRAAGGQQGQPPKKARREGQAAAAGRAAAGGAAGEDADFKFAKIEVEEGRPGKPHGPGAKRPPKQVLLKQAEAQKAELEALAGTQEGKAKAQQAAWKAALARAAGEKVLDDPKLLRRSLKRENKVKEKHSKAWKERLSAQQEAQAARQAKRNDNLAARRQTKLDNKKAKREKKLLRPGFEGRKEGFISGPGKAAAGGAAK